ncbi:MAG: MerR family transcriptional regulator [Clostridium sp.]
MKFIKYPVGSVCKILNITQGGIRFYEQKGIIKGRRETENNYRFFTFRDIYTIMTIREYRNLGFSLEMAGNLTSVSTIKDIDCEIQKQFNICEKEIIEKQLILKKLREKSNQLNAIVNNSGKFYYKNRMSLYRLSCQCGNTVIKCSEAMEVLKKWSNITTKVKGCPCIPLEKLKDKYPAEVGVCLYEKDINFPIDKNKYIKYYKETSCLCTIVQVTDNDLFIEGFYTLLNPIFTYIKENNLEIIGDIMGDKIATINNNGQIDFYEVFIPVK